MKRIDRSFTLLFVLATLVVVAAPGCAARRARSPDLAGPTLKDAGLARYWTADVPIPSGDSLAKVYLVDDTLYLYTLNGIVFAVQADTGLIRWGKKLSARNLSIQKPGHITATPGYSLAAFVTPGGTQILDRYTGETIASFPNEFAVGGAPVGVGDTLFMGSADGNVYALVWHTAGSGETIQWWTVRAGGPVPAADVEARIGLRNAAVLGLEQGIRIGASMEHFVENEVGRSVEDPSQGQYLAADHVSPDDVEHGKPATERRAVEDAHVGVRRETVELLVSESQGPLVGQYQVQSVLKRRLTIRDAGLPGVEVDR